jgi:uncharacterized protein YfaA (DUF2138 family)
VKRYASNIIGIMSKFLLILSKEALNKLLKPINITKAKTNNIIKSGDLKLNGTNAKYSTTTNKTKDINKAFNVGFFCE